MTPVEVEIARMLGEVADFPADQITARTRIHHDAKLGGEDFCQFIEMVHERFGVVLPLSAGSYAPGEVMGLWDFLTWPFGRRPNYQEVTVGDLSALAVLSEADAIKVS